MSDTEFILILGDLYTPSRSLCIPNQFKELLKNNKISAVFCTGNLGSDDVKKELEEISSNLYITKGDFDKDDDLPEYINVKIGEFTFGMIHGHQIVPWGNFESLKAIAIQINCDVLISGHTHELSIITKSDRCYINPSTCTGAYQPWAPNPIPSFVLLAVNNDKIMIYTYQLNINMDNDGKPNVNMIKWSKNN